MNNNVFTRFWNVLHSLADTLFWLPPLIARISIGAVFIVSGWGKLHHLDKVVGFFTQLGIPAPQIQAPFVASVELVCGVAVLFGFLTRLTALPLIGVMVVAILTAKLKMLSGIAEFLGIEEFLLIVLLLWLHIAGPGPVSVDQVLLKDKK